MSDIGKFLYGWGPLWTFLVESPPDLIGTEYGCMICAKQAFRVPSNLAQPEIGCMIYDKQAFRVPPDSAQPEIGCMIYDKQAFRVPSNLAQPEIGCMICARQAFRVPSDSAQTEDGCRASTRQAWIRLKLKMDVESTRQAFSRAIRFGDKPKRMEKMPEMCQKSAQESFKSLHSHPSPQKYSPIKHGRDD